MRLNNIHKGGIVFLIILLFVGLGGYLFVYPNVNDLVAGIGTEKELRTAIDESEEALRQNEILQKDYETALAEAIEAQKSFYPEMTVMQTVDEINRFLEVGHFYAESGITASGIKSKNLAISINTENEHISYDIRQYSFLQELAENGELNTEETSKTEEAENPENDDNEYGEISQEEAYRLLLSDKTNRDQKLKLTEILRSMLADKSVEIGHITASFSLRLTYNEYLRFLEYIDMLERATAVTSASFKGADIDKSQAESYSFTIDMYVIKPVDVL